MNKPTINGAGKPQSDWQAWRGCWLIYVQFFLMGVEMNLLIPMLPTIAKDYNLDIGTAGLVIVAYVIVYAFAAPGLGYISDRFSRKAMICWGASIFAVGTLGCAVAPNFAMLVSARAVTGLGGSVVGPSSWAYLAEHVPAEIRARTMAFGSSIYALGQVIGVPVGAFIASIVGWHYTFLLVGVLVGWLVIMARNILVSKETSRPIDPRQPVVFWKRASLLFALLATFSFQAARMGTYSYVGVIFSTRFGLSLRDLGVQSLFVGVATVIGATSAGWCFDQIAATKISIHWLGVGISLAVATFVVLALVAGNLMLATGCLLLWSYFGAGFHAYVQTYIATTVPYHRATIIAWNTSLLHGGIAIGTLLLGRLPIGGGLFTALAGIMALMSALFIFLVMLAELRTVIVYSDQV